MLKDPVSDLFGYSSLAKHLAESIIRMAPADGFVMSINGPWGSGKTSFLNFIQSFLNQLHEDERPIIINFNPWWYSGREDLLRSFFLHLTSNLRKDVENIRKLRQSLSFYAKKLSSVPIPYSGSIRTFGEIIQPGEKSLNELRSNIEKILLSLPFKIVILIDDIDRLTNDEIKQLFNVVKSVTNLPNLVYILAFDKKVISNALSDEFPGKGEEFLEKIVQAPFDLPFPDRFAIRNLLFEKLDVILSDKHNETFDEIYWANVYFDGLDVFINTPRDVMRIINSLTITYPTVAGEVNPVDFIAIELIRIKLPNLYNTIFYNREYFCGRISTSSYSQMEKEKLEKFHGKWLENIGGDEIREYTKKLITRLFPKLNSIWSVTYTGSHALSEWRKNCRICSDDIFPIYFRLNVPEETISTRMIINTFPKMNNCKNISCLLINLSKEIVFGNDTKARLYLERLQDYTERDIPESSISPIITSLFDVGDKLWEAQPDRIGIYKFNIDQTIHQVLSQLIIRLNQKKRFQVIKEAIENGDSVSIASREVRSLGRSLNSSRSKSG